MTGPRRSISIRTRRQFAATASRVWPLLCTSSMDRSSSLLFRLGVPQPLECRLPDGTGGVGSERECISDQGVVRQRIVAWEPERRLGFRMEKAELVSARRVRAVEDEFTLEPRRSGVRVLRETTVLLADPVGIADRMLLYVAFKQVHRYVFRNWRRLASGPAGPSGATPQREPGRTGHSR